MKQLESPKPRKIENELKIITPMNASVNYQNNLTLDTPPEKSLITTTSNINFPNINIENPNINNKSEFTKVSGKLTKSKTSKEISIM